MSSRPRRSTVMRAPAIPEYNFSGWYWVPKGRGVEVYNNKKQRVLSTGIRKNERKAFTNMLLKNKAFAENHKSKGTGGVTPQPRGTKKTPVLQRAASIQSSGSVNNGNTSGNSNNGNNNGARVATAAKESWRNYLWRVSSGLVSWAAKGAAKLRKNHGRATYIPGWGALSQPFKGAVTGFRPMFSMAQLQAWSGSQLETEAIEFAVQDKKITSRKFRRTNGSKTDAAQLFDCKVRTFFFKPRFNLDAIKKDTSPIWGKVMKEIVNVTSEKGKGKGVDAVETDVIEVLPPKSRDEDGVVWEDGLIRLYECKIGLGKPEGRGKASESLQLMKAKRLLLIYWSQLRPNQPPPTIRCYFLAWKYGIDDSSGVPVLKKIDVVTSIKNVNPIDFTHHRIPYINISKALRSAAGEDSTKQENNSTNTFTHWDDVQTLNPERFEKLTGLKKDFVSSWLDANRAEVFSKFRMLLHTLEGRGAFWANIPENARRRLGVKVKLVSGEGVVHPPPQEPQEAFELRLKGQLGNFMEVWNEKFYNHIKNENNRKRTINAAKRYMGNKAIRAAERLSEQGYIILTKNGRVLKNKPAYSASELERPVNAGKRFTNKKNIDEYIKRVKMAIKRADNILLSGPQSYFKNAKLEIVNTSVRRPSDKMESKRHQVSPKANLRSNLIKYWSTNVVNVALANSLNFEKTYMKFLNNHGGPGNAANNVGKLIISLRNSGNINNANNKLNIKQTVNNTYLARRAARTAA